MRVTKSMLREAWERQPGLGFGGRFGPEGLSCATQAIRLSVSMDLVSGDLWIVLVRTNDSFHPDEGVTPEERRDCMIALADAGAFDAWLEEA